MHSFFRIARTGAVLSIGVASDQPAVAPQPVYAPSAAMPTEPQPAAKSSRSITPWVVFFLFVVIAGAGAWWLLTHRKSTVLTSSPPVGAPENGVNAPRGPRPAQITIDPEAPKARPSPKDSK